MNDMDDSDALDSLRHALVHGWSLPGDVQPSLDRLLAALAERVRQLLDSDSSNLATAMYTLDIDELRFQTAMNLPGNDMKSTAVAELILERESQKIESRRRYEEMKRQSQIEDTEEPPIDV
jgi:hypothetical protein